jgi:hypothetical protein
MVLITISWFVMQIKRYLGMDSCNCEVRARCDLPTVPENNETSLLLGEGNGFAEKFLEYLIIRWQIRVRIRYAI